MIRSNIRGGDVVVKVIDVLIAKLECHEETYEGEEHGDTHGTFDGILLLEELQEAVPEPLMTSAPELQQAIMEVDPDDVDVESTDGEAREEEKHGILHRHEAVDIHLDSPRVCGERAAVTQVQATEQHVVPCYLF